MRRKLACWASFALAFVLGGAAPTSAQTDPSFHAMDLAFPNRVLPLVGAIQPFVVTMPCHPANAGSWAMRILDEPDGPAAVRGQGGTFVATLECPDRYYRLEQQLNLTPKLTLPAFESARVPFHFELERNLPVQTFGPFERNATFAPDYMPDAVIAHSQSYHSGGVSDYELHVRNQGNGPTWAEWGVPSAPDEERNWVVTNRSGRMLLGPLGRDNATGIFTIRLEAPGTEGTAVMPLELSSADPRSNATRTILVSLEMYGGSVPGAHAWVAFVTVGATVFVHRHRRRVF